VRRPRVTIDAAVLASAIWVQARFKTDIRTGVAGDNGFRSVAKILRRREPCLFSPRPSIDCINVSQIDMQFLKSIRWTPRSAAPPKRPAALRRFFDDGPEFVFRRHVISSHEHSDTSSRFPHHSITYCCSWPRCSAQTVKNVFRGVTRPFAASDPLCMRGSLRINIYP
jgi:hypothetical protein